MREVLPPQEGHTFLKCPAVSLHDLQPGIVAVLGVPFDATKNSRLGARYGPDAIRQGSFVFSFLMQSRKDGFVDLDKGVRITQPDETRIVDLGNLPAVPIDLEGTITRVADTVSDVVQRRALPVILGGDHFVSYPSMRGFFHGIRLIHPEVKIGYVQVDVHLDLSDHVPYWGKYHSGSPARRIAELQGMDPTRMVFLGINGFQPGEDLEFVRKSGVRIVPMSHIKRRGVQAAAQEVQDLLADCDQVYVSIDIDVVDGASAPGTGATTFGGLSSAELLELVAILRELPLGALDLMEVAPNWDPSGRTQALAAAVIIEMLSPRIFNMSAAAVNDLVVSLSKK